VSISPTAGGLWPADVIHVNEDGWVLINRGSQHGVILGLRLLVVGTGTRELLNLFPPEGAPQSPVLRIRRTYELLEVIHAEPDCAIAIAARTPATRRPTVYRGPEGELLVWAPLPEGYTWPPTGATSDDANSEITPPVPPAPRRPPWLSPADDDASMDAGEDDDDIDPDSPDEADAPPERALQDDEPWEEALPLNSVSVGDIVLPAIPASPTASSAPMATSEAVVSEPHVPASTFDHGRTYDRMKKPGE
jgi:hypothetical protein